MRVIRFFHFNAKARLLLTSVVAITLITTGVIYGQTKSRLIPIYEVQTNEKILALTFDISWGTETPLPVINLLKEHDVQCTFFLSGPWARKYPELPQRIAQDGHEIASHGQRHINLSSLTSVEIQQEIKQAHAILEEITGHSPKLIRTPNGDYNDEVVLAAQACGYQVIQWGTDSLDWKNPGIEAIINRVLTRAHPGDIILMHASDSCKQTVQALPPILQGLKEKGYRLVTVSELLENKVP